MFISELCQKGTFGKGGGGGGGSSAPNDSPLPPPPPRYTPDTVPQIRMKSTSLSRCSDYYSNKYDRIVNLGDFNSEPTNEPVETFCSSYNLYNLIKEKTCFKGPPKCYDLIIN